MECRNCGNSFKGNFCNTCGQNSRVEKLSAKSFLEELSESVFQLNHGLFFTVKSLFLRPGHAIREFLEGQRKFHFKPIAYVLVISTFYYLITQIFEANNLVDDFLGGVNKAKEERLESVESSPLLSWFSSNFAYAILLLIPFFSVATYLSFYNKSFNFLEHIVINSYITGQQMFFYGFLTIVGVLIGNQDSMIFTAVILSIIYRFWAYIQLFNRDKRIRVFLRLLLSYFMFYIILAVIMMFGLLTYLLINK